MTYTQKAVGILIGFIILLVLFWLIIYTPESNKLDNLQQEVKALDLKIINAKAQKDNLPEIENKIKNARERLERLEVQYPKTIEIVYQAITDAAEKEGFIISKRVTAEKQGEDEETALREYEINISAYCPYHILGDFLDRLVNSQIIISISGLAIVADRDAGFWKGGENELRVEMQLTTYLSRDNGS